MTRFWQTCLKYLAIFLGLVSIWQHLEPTLAIFMISNGQIFMVVKAKYLKMILPSGHTGSHDLDPPS